MLLRNSRVAGDDACYIMKTTNMDENVNYLADSLTRPTYSFKKHVLHA